jgi:hypothetical protein
MRKFARGVNNGRWLAGSLIDRVPMGAKPTNQPTNAYDAVEPEKSGPALCAIPSDRVQWRLDTNFGSSALLPGLANSGFVI